MHIALIGLRASGKTTIARILAEQLQWRHVDLDELVLERNGYDSVARYFMDHGESAWRTGELDAFDTLDADEDLVLSLGGGAPMIDRIHQVLQQRRADGSALVILLDPPLQVMQQRLKAETGDRPSLTGQSPADELEQISQARRPRMLELADQVIDTSRHDPDECVESIKRFLSGRQEPGSA
ncbi:MAG: hypothetical protein CMJ32_09285 [Phycisphaerae bacterium]|nr:hypothetical protein [Phycisphaerae bacterium]